MPRQSERKETRCLNSGKIGVRGLPAFQSKDTFHSCFTVAAGSLNGLNQVLVCAKSHAARILQVTPAAREPVTTPVATASRNG